MNKLEDEVVQAQPADHSKENSLILNESVNVGFGERDTVLEMLQEVQDRPETVIEADQT